MDWEVTFVFNSVFIMDGTAIAENGFFHGYTIWTLFAITLQSFGGILVAMVVKYADSVLKGVATGLSVVVSCLLSYYFFDFQISFQFIVGSALVVYGVSLYLKKPVKESTLIQTAQFQKLEKLEID